MGQTSTRYQSLTEDEKVLIKDSFQLLRNFLKECGVGLFVILFTEYPKIMEHFPFTSTEDEGFEKHCDRFMRELAVLVKCIDKPDAILKILTVNAQKHIPRNVTAEDYNAMRIGIVRTFEQQLGPAVFTSNTNQAWTKALKLVFGFIFDTTDEMRREAAKKKK